MLPDEGWTGSWEDGVKGQDLSTNIHELYLTLRKKEEGSVNRFLQKHKRPRSRIVTPKRAYEHTLTSLRKF